MRVGRLFPLLLAGVALLANPAGADSAWTIPGIVNASGLNGTHFVSDLTLTNPGGAPANVTLSLFPSGASSKALALAPGQTVVSTDVVASLFGSPGTAGAVSVASDQPLVIRAKTYNTAASGTYGVALPVVASDRLLAPGDVGDSLWISQDPSPSEGYRTNVALVFPDPSGGAATVTVYDADGLARGSQDFSLDAPGLQQFSVGSFAGAVSIGRAQVAVTRGHAAGYAVVVDNVTGDSSLFAFEDLPAGIQDVLVNGVARASGRNGAFFRTDGRFYNPTDTDATVQVAFHANGNANPSPAVASFVVPAGRIRDVVDVLDSLLSLPVGSAGALRFQSEWPVAILCRTSNVDPAGARPGTFGSQQKPVPLLSFVSSADAGAAITGIRQNSAFRTNVGFAGGADGAQYTLTLADASGGVVATTTGSLGAFGWSQPNVQDLFPSTTIPDNATLRVKVTAGSVDVFDSSIDNLSGDPVVTPIAALPVDIPSSATIGPQGGSIRSDDGRLTLRIPAGALASGVLLAFVTNASNDAPQGTGASYTLSPGGLGFTKPATLVFRYGSDDVVGSSPGAMGLAFRNGSTWFVETGGSVNAVARTLAVPITSTAPAAAATPAAFRALVDSPGVDWGAFRSIQIFPKKAALPTSGMLTLVVLDVGASSSESSIFGSSPLGPVDPSRLTYAWYLNGSLEALEDPADGTLVSHDGNNATYTAPRCVPTNNPVNIAVKLSHNQPDVSGPHSKALGLLVRVLARDWTFTASLDQEFECPLVFADDHVRYESSLSFSIDDNLNVTMRADSIDTREYFGSPTACDKTNVDLARKGDPQMHVGLNSGVYDVDRDVFRLELDWFIPTGLGYDYVTIGNDGSRFPGEFSLGPVVPVVGLEYGVREGPHPYLAPVPPTGPIQWEWDLERKESGCP